MPLYPNAERLIRGNIAVIKRGQKPRPVIVGRLTESQVEAVNSERARKALVRLSGELFFIGSHVYESRIVKDGYSEEDLITMIKTAASCALRR